MTKTALRFSLAVSFLAIGACARTDLFPEVPAGPVVTVTPATASVVLTASQAFTASVSPAQAVDTFSWSILPAGVGTIDATGHYTAPAALPTGVSNPNTVTIRATLTGQTSVFGDAVVTLTAPPSGPVASLVKVSGDNQTVTVEQQLGQPLVVKALDAHMVPVSGVSVTFETAAGVNDWLTAVTGANGLAQAQPKAGPVAGPQSFVVSHTGLPPVTFSATALAGPVAQMKASDAMPTDTVGAMVPAPLFLVFEDQYKNPIEGASATVTTPLGATAAPITMQSDATGTQKFAIQLGLEVGPQIFTFVDNQSAMVSTTFQFTAQPGVPAALLLVSGDKQSGPAGSALPTPLAVQVVDANNLPVPGVTIGWSVTGGGTLSMQQTTTDANGNATAQFTLGDTAGIEQVVISAGTITNSPLTLVETSLPGPAVSLTILSGGTQSATTGTLFGSAFSVQAVDQFGNPVPGVSIGFAALMGGGTVATPMVTSDANGDAQTQLTAGPSAGPETFSASIVTLGVISGTVDITVTATAPGAYLLTIVSGNNQSLGVGSTLEPLVVKVTLNGMPAAGQAVQFGVTIGDGTVSAASVMTNAMGIAQTTATLGSLAGPEEFAASLTGASNSPLLFQETATGATVALLEVVSGSGQTGAPGSALGAPLVVLALGANGQAVANAVITFTVPMGGSVSSVTVTTNAMGMAQVTATLGPTPGPQTFTAASGAATATFTETASNNMTGEVLVIVSGQDQSAQVGLQLTQPLVVEVTNDAGVPLPGVTITWTAGSPQATVSAGSNTTNAMGQAQVMATLGKPIGTQEFTASCTGCTNSPAIFTENGTVAPADKLIVASGDGQAGLLHAVLPQPLVAEAVDRVGNPISGITITFAAVTGGSVAPTSGTTAAAGTVSVKATLGGTTGPETFTASAMGINTVTFTETATNQISSISVSPQDKELQQGASQQYTATAIYVDGTTGDITTVATWSTGSSSIATVSNATGAEGLLKTVSPGTTTVTATFAGFSGSTPLTVDAATLQTIDVTPANGSVEVGSTLQYQATGAYSDQLVSSVTSTCTWSSSNTSVATVSNTAGSNGLVTGVHPGTAVISCTLMGVTGSRTVTVTAAPITQLEITPVHVSGVVGGSTSFTATATFADGTVQNVTVEAAWSSSSNTVLTVQNAPAQAGLATYIAAGTANVVVTYDGLTATEAVTVTAATVTSIVVAPGMATLAQQNTVQLQATATYSNGSTANVTAIASWTSSDNTIASVSIATGTSGLVTGIAQGTATITASLGGQSASSTITVNGSMSMGMVVFQTGHIPMNPLNTTMLTCAKGQVLDLEAGALYTGGGGGGPGGPGGPGGGFQIVNITSESNWSSSNPAIATVGNGANAGVVTCLAAGTVNITAAWDGQSNTADLTVTAAVLQSIAVSPNTLSLSIGDTVTLVAIGTYSDGTTATITALGTWDSSSGTVATVSNAAGSHGEVTAVGAGMATITITYEGVSATVPVTVSSAMLTNVIIAPANPSYMFNTGGGMGGPGGPGGPGGGRGPNNTHDMTATALYSDGSTQDVTTLGTWSTSDPTIATVSNTTGTAGQVTILATGMCQIIVTYSGLTGKTTLTAY